MTKWERILAGEKIVVYLNGLTHEQRVAVGMQQSPAPDTKGIINMVLEKFKVPIINYIVHENRFAIDYYPQDQPHVYEDWYSFVSTSVAKLRHITLDPGRGELYVMFVKGKVYRYDNVPVTIFEQLLQAPSVGEAFDALIKKGGFTYKDLPGYEVSQ